MQVTSCRFERTVEGEMRRMGTSGERKKKSRKAHNAGKKEVSEAKEERKAGDVEEWRPLKASIEQSVITEEEGRQTASLFFGPPREDGHQFPGGGVTGAGCFLLTLLGGGPFLTPLVHSS